MLLPILILCNENNIAKLVVGARQKNYSEWQQMITIGTKSDNAWYRVTTNDNEWQWAVILANFFSFFRITEKINTMHYKENTLGGLVERLSN